MKSKKDDVFVTAVLAIDELSVSVSNKTKELANILRQKYSNYEVIVVDNGCLPKESESLKKLLPTTPCIRVIELSKNHDADTAIFVGVDASIGDYICILYGSDPVELVPKFIEKAAQVDIVFGVASNMKRKNHWHELGAKVFYWYNRRFLHINIPNGSTYFICMNRLAANALTKSGRFMRHIRPMAKQVGFSSENYSYRLPESGRYYADHGKNNMIERAIDLVANYSRHPLRAVSYLGIFVGLLNISYALYVVIVNLSSYNVAKGWTTLSLQSSFMFFILFMVMAVLAEYIGRILEETRKDSPYYITKELSSTVSIADETRRNVTK